MAEIKKIQIGDITLAYREFGSGEKYLLSAAGLRGRCEFLRKAFDMSQNESGSLTS